MSARGNTAEEMAFRPRHCSLCSFCSPKNYSLVKHLFEAHSHDCRFHFVCPTEGCSRIFGHGSSFPSLLSHMNRKHPVWKEKLENSGTATVDIMPPRPESPEHETPAASGSGASGSEAVINPELSSDVDIVGSSHSSQDQALRDDHFQPACDSRAIAGKFLLMLKERHNMTQTAISFAIDSVKKLITRTSNDLIATASATGVNIDSENIDPFHGLETEYFQTKYYKQHLGLVEPVTVELGASYEYQKCGAKRRLVEKKDTFQYVPLVENIQALLQNKEVFEQVSQSHMRSDGLLGDVCDGILFKTHPLFGEDPLALQLLIYFDEVEVVNPIGAHRGVHKLGLFYYVLGNIHPKLRSTLRPIQLIAAVTTPLLQEYGFEKVLKPFIVDANKLTEGVNLSIGQRSVFVKGAVLLMLADTLAAHAIGGFKVGVGFALRKCRDCMATKKIMTEKFKAEDFLLRTPASYDYHCSLLDGCLADSDSVTYGVNFRSPLNDLKHFHVANTQLPQDVMHVLFEGVVKDELNLLLKYLVASNYFSGDLLNERIACFYYTPDESRNKPCSLNLQRSISQSAVQTWILAIYLPLYIGDKIPVGDEKWECYLLLLDIIQICTSRIMSEECANYLSGLILDHHQLFKKCYPSASITPKFHYMVHFGRQILRTGPLLSSWCMRMEAKHSYFKRISQVGNFKNIAYSLARRHQRLMCLYLNEDDFFSTKMETGPAIGAIPLSEEPTHIKEGIEHILPDLAEVSSIKRTKWIKVSGYTYQPKLFMITGFQSDDLPCFSRIEDLFVVDQEPFAVVSEYVSEGIIHHFHSYAIKCSERRRVTHLRKLIEPRPMHCHSLIGDPNIHITLRSFVMPCNCS